jgi:UDP-N-acetylmuramate--alanine ligase
MPTHALQSVPAPTPGAPNPVGPVAMALKTRNPFLIGIGGAGMSALARVLQADGARVAGTDSVASDITANLQTAGIPVHADQGSTELPVSVDLVITLRRGAGAVHGGRTGVSIAGTHGKSTTTAMLGCVLTDAGSTRASSSVRRASSCRRGARSRTRARRAGRGTGFRLGANEIPVGARSRGEPGLLLAEACEFNRSFHHHRPTVGSIANVEADHLDIYGSLDAVVEAFAGSRRLLPPAAAGGRLLIGHDGAHRREITAGLRAPSRRSGSAPRRTGSSRDRPRGPSHLRRGPGGVTASFANTMPGEHNAMNSRVRRALAITLGADPEIVGGRSPRSGARSAMQPLGERATRGGSSGCSTTTGTTRPRSTPRSGPAADRLRGRRRRATAGRLMCVFQPHQHSRTRFLLDEFATSFEHADVVIVPHIYFVRDSEAEKHKVSAADLVDRLRSRGVRAMHLYPLRARSSSARARLPRRGCPRSHGRGARVAASRTRSSPAISTASGTPAIASARDS